MAEPGRSKSKLIGENARDELYRSIFGSLENGKLKTAKELTLALHIADIADLVEKAPSSEQRNKLLDILKPFNSLLFVEIQSVSVKEDVIEYLGYDFVAKSISQLEIDDAFDVLVDIQEHMQERIIEKISNEKKKEINELFSYPENSAGRIMQKKFVALPETITVGEAILCIQNDKNLPKDFYCIFIVDNKLRPKGFISLGTLLSNKSDTTLKEIEKTKMQIISTNLDQEEMSYIFKQYGLISIPVVNKIGRLVGVVTLDDAVEVIEKEAEEDLMLMGGVHELDFHLEILEVVKSRFPWLCLNLLTASIAAFVIQGFSATIEQIVVLAAIMPIVASLGGNAGTQTMTVSLLGIVSKDITSVNSFKIISKQIIACFLNGFLLAIFGSIALFIWQKKVFLSIIFFISIIVNFVLAGFFGSAIPLLIKKIGADPAVASPILLTTLTDIFGFLIFLALASYFF